MSSYSWRFCVLSLSKGCPEPHTEVSCSWDPNLDLPPAHTLSQSGWFPSPRIHGNVTAARARGLWVCFSPKHTKVAARIRDGEERREPDPLICRRSHQPSSRMQSGPGKPQPASRASSGRPHIIRLEMRAIGFCPSEE